MRVCLPQLAQPTPLDALLLFAPGLQGGTDAGQLLCACRPVMPWPSMQPAEHQHSYCCSILPTACSKVRHDCLMALRWEQRALPEAVRDNLSPAEVEVGSGCAAACSSGGGGHDWPGGAAECSSGSSRDAPAEQHDAGAAAGVRQPLPLRQQQASGTPSPSTEVRPVCIARLSPAGSKVWCCILYWTPARHASCPVTSSACLHVRLTGCARCCSSTGPMMPP